jgi:DNA-binding NarL/FixJ family response regulator
VAAIRPLRVLIADDDPLVRAALQDALSGSIHVTVVGAADSGRSAIELAAQLAPDVVLMDPELPDIDGITATLRIRRDDPRIRVVMLATGDDDELALLSLRAGAVGFMVKDTTADALRRVVEGVVDDQAAISRSLALRLIERMRWLPEHGLRPVRGTLTAREWQVLDLMSRNRPTSEIAAELVLSIDTVRSHIKHILAKLGVHSRGQAIKVAETLRRGDEVAGPEDSDVEEAAFQRVLHRLRDFRESR